MTEQALTKADALKMFLVKHAETLAKDLADRKAGGSEFGLEKELLDRSVNRWRRHDPEGFGAYMDRLRARDEATK